MAEHVHALPSGYRFEEYEIVRVLGSGGFGITYLAFDDNLDKAVAIKEYLPSDLAIRHASTVVPKSSSDENDFEWGLERFLDEAKTLARFKHHNLIQVHRFFRAHGTAYIVMEYAEGATLTKKLVTHGPYKEDELLDMLLPIIDGLTKVHAADYLHRDIKPGNIIIRDDETPVLIDFGAARQAIGAKSRSVTSIISPGYAPIEQYAAKGNQGAWTDIYALGAVAYKCVTGDTPIDAAERVLEDGMIPLAEKMPAGYSENFLRAVDAALRVDVKDRPKTLRSWKNMLLGHSDLLSLRRGGRKRRKPVPKGGKKKAAGINYALIAAVGAVMVVGIAGFVYWQMDSKEGRRTAGPVSSTTTETPPKATVNALILPVQVALNKLGYTVSESATLDARTRAAIREFERQNGLVQTGEADQVVLDALKRAVAVRDQDEAEWRTAQAADTIGAYQNYKRGRPDGAHVAEADTRIAAFRQVQLVRDIQTELVRLGWLKGGIDGNLGLATIAAIQAFQRDARLVADGRASQDLLRQLRGATVRAYVVARDGSGDFTTIAAAIAAAPAGTRIRIHPGTYNESLVIDKTLHLEGVGHRSRIILESTDNRAITINSGAGSVSNMTIRFAGGANNWFTMFIGGGTWRIENNDLTNLGDVATIQVEGGNPTIASNVIADFKKEGIYITGNATGTYTGNTIYGGGGELVVVEGTADPYFSENRMYGAITAIEIRGDARGRFENNDISARIKVREQARPTFRSNDIHDIDGNAINIKGTGGGLFETNNVFNSGNTEKNFPAIWVSKDSVARLIRNRIYGSGWPNIYLEDPTKSVLSGNDVRS